MIVTCERCASQFQLDEKKISPEGVRVRCSRCEHAFFVESPAQPDADHAENLVRDTLGSARLNRPEPVVDEPEEASIAAPDESLTLEPIESDWKFNDDDEAMDDPSAEGTEDDLAAAREAVDDLLGGAPELDTDLETTGVAEPGSLLGLEPDARGESDVETFDVEASAEHAAANFVFDSDADLQASPNAEAEVAQEVQTSFEGGGDDASSDFDDPANWDIFDPEPADVEEASAADAQVDDSEVSESPEVTPIGAALPGVTAPGEPDRRAVEITGWAVMVALVAVCLFGGLSTPTPEAMPKVVESATAPGFELQGVSARWIDNAVVGPMYVISGNIRRSAGSTRSNVIPLEIRLLDASGKSLDLPASPIGPKIAEKSLRETNPSALVDMQQKRAGHFATIAGTWSRFDAVVPATPNSAKRFEFSPTELAEGS